VLLASRSWRWLELQILGLLDRPVAGYAPNGRAVFPNRLQEHFYGPAADAAVERAAANAKRRG
jgi:hypothetical protein